MSRPRIGAHPMSLRERIGSFSFHDLPTARAGLVALVLLAGGITGAFVFGGQGGFTRTYEASAVFTDSAGLDTGAPVEMAGVEVGRVREVAGDFELGQVVVTMDIERDVDVGQGARASIAMANLLGGQAVRLSGPVEAPLLADVPVEQRRIPVDRTTVVGGVVDSLDATTTAIGEVDTELVARVTDQVAEVLAGTRDTAPDALEDLGEIGDVLDGRGDQLAGTADDVRVLTEVVADRQAEIDELVASSTQLFEELATRREQLAVLFGEGDRTVRRLTRFLADHGDALQAVSEDVHEVAGVVEGLSPEVSEALALLGPTFERLAAARGDGPWIDFTSPSFGPITSNDDAVTSGVQP